MPVGHVLFCRLFGKGSVCCDTWSGRVVQIWLECLGTIITKSNFFPIVLKAPRQECDRDCFEFSLEASYLLLRSILVLDAVYSGGKTISALKEC